MPVPELLADGGASRNDALMQFQADILGVPVVRNRSTDVSALGAAWLAGLAVGIWTSVDDLRMLRRDTDRFEPRMPDARTATALRRLAARPSRAPRQTDAARVRCRQDGGLAIWRASTNCD